MEAKDTVMKDEQIMKLAQVPPKDYGAPPGWWLRANCRVAQAQAEISFQAGMKEVRLQLRAKIGGIDEFCDWSDEGLKQFRKLTLKVVEDFLKERVE